MRDGFMVIDADRHVMEPSDLWDRYLPEAFRGRVHVGGPTQGVRMVDGTPVSDSFRFRGPSEPWEETAPIFSGSPRYREAFADALAAGFNPESNLRDMDREGIDVRCSSPRSASTSCGATTSSPQLSAAICRAYNTWLAEYCQHDPSGLKGVALIPLQDPELAVEELRHAREQLGLVGIFWRPNPLRGRTLRDPDYFPIYEVASDLGVTVCVHEGARTVMQQAGSDRYSEFGRHIACHPIEQMLACLTLCADGVLERFPTLKVAHLESGWAGCRSGWSAWTSTGSTISHGATERRPEPPSAYFKRQCVVSCEAGEEMVGSFVEHVGDDHLVMATDYPHPDAIAKFPDRTVGDLTTSPSLGREQTQDPVGQPRARSLRQSTRRLAALPQRSKRASQSPSPLAGEG